MAKQSAGKSAASGTLIIIGGHEDKNGKKVILEEVVRRVAKGKLVVTTVASHQPEGYFETYQKAFQRLGLDNIVELSVRERSEAYQEEMVKLLEGAKGVFFTGGDQLRITSQIGDSPVWRRIQEVHEAGGVICGTSAGASAMCETMLVQGEGEESHHLGSLRMAPGLGFIQNVIIDQHFAERGRMGRLLGAVALNPRELGIGIDEDTAVVMKGKDAFTVVGSGAVYVVDGSGVTYSNIAEGRDDEVLKIHDLKLHVLSQGDMFNLDMRRPEQRSEQADASQIAADK